MTHLNTMLSRASIACCLLCLGCTENPSAVIPNYRQFVTREVVFYSSNRQGSARNIFMMTTDGQTLKQITRFPEGDYVATAISPDGSRLLFYQAAPGFDIDVAWNIYLYHIASDSIVGPITQGQPGNFSPDGRAIVLSRHTYTSDGGYESIYVHDLTNGTETKLTEDGKTSFYPQFSPDGNSIVFESAKFTFRDSISCWQLHLLDLRSHTITDLTKAENAYYAGNPVFSPDGSSILFHYNERTWCYDICRMSLATRTISYLTRNRYDGRFNITSSFYNPSVSATSETVFFYSYFVDYQYPHPIDVYSVNSDGSSLTNITKDSFWDSHPIVGTVSFYLAPRDSY